MKVKIFYSKILHTEGLVLCFVRLLLVAFLSKVNIMATLNLYLRGALFKFQGDTGYYNQSFLPLPADKCQDRNLKKPGLLI